MSVVRSSDSMPPVPEYTTTEEYLRPADFPGEWGVHEEMTDLMEIAIPPSVSPFVLPSSANRIEREFRLAVLASVYSPEEGATLTEKIYQPGDRAQSEQEPTVATEARPAVG